MDERTTMAPPEHAQPTRARIEEAPGTVTSTASASGLADPRALTILTTEHWSLLSARSLVYNEAFARGGMFLTFLSATLVALGLVSAGVGFDRDFLMVAAGVLGLDLFIGLATLGRLATASAEDLRSIQAMNRLRHAYHEVVPGLEAYFSTSPHDDITGVLGAYDAATAPPVSRFGILHGFTTMPGMVSVICGAIGAALAAIVLELLSAPAPVTVTATVVVLIAGVALGVFWMTRVVGGFIASLSPRFPTAPRERAGADPNRPR